MKEFFLLISFFIKDLVLFQIANKVHFYALYLDDLSKITDETLSKRKSQVPKAEGIVEAVKQDFNAWLETRKFAPTIKALKSKLKEIQLEEIDYQRKKQDNFNEGQAIQVSDRIIQKITKHFANHLKEEATSSESIALISKVFHLEETES